MSRKDFSPDVTARDIEQVRSVLPDVMVEVQGETVPAHVYGRENRFGTVSPLKYPAVRCEVAWPTLARSVKYRTVIRLD